MYYLLFKFNIAFPFIYRHKIAVYILKRVKSSAALPVLLGMRNGPCRDSSAVCMQVPNQEISQYVTTAFAEFQRTANLEHTLRSAKDRELQSANLICLLFTEFKEQE